MTDAAILLTATDVGRLLTMRECIDEVAGVFRAHENRRSHGPVSCGLKLPDGTLHAKMAAIESDRRLFVVVKANVNLPGNAERHGCPTIQGALLLFDGADGRPLAVMDSIVLTSLRTAAVAALAADHLALADAHTITLVGCGEQGEAQLRAMAEVRRLRRAFMVDIDVRKAHGLAERLAPRLGFQVEVVESLSSAVRDSDICVTCTTSQKPLLFRDHLHPGLFVAAVGADNPGKQEIDAAALADSRVVVDSLTACAAGGDLHHALRAGLLTERDVHGELSAVVTGQVAGRTHADEVFVFDSTGTALQDVAAAVLVYRHATESGAGVRMILDDRFSKRAPAV